MRVALCPGCGCGLVPSQIVDSHAPPAERSEKKRIEFVELCRPRAYPVAMLIKQMLEQNGVAATVQGGQSMSMLPHLAFVGQLRIFVDKDQFDYAQALYSAYFESDEETFYIPDDEH